MRKIVTRKHISSTGENSPFQMYNSEGRFGQAGDGEASVNVYIYKFLAIIFFNLISLLLKVHFPFVWPIF
jgi:hypothetical protein